MIESSLSKSIIKLIIIVIVFEDRVLVLLLNKLLSFVSSHFDDELEGHILVVVAFLQGKDSLFESNLVILAGIDDAIRLGEDLCHFYLGKYLYFNTDGFSKIETNSMSMFFYFVFEHTELKLVEFLFIEILSLRIRNGVSSNLNWNCDIEITLGIDLTNWHLEFLVDLVSQANKIEAWLVVLLGVVPQNNFDMNCLSSSSFNDFLWNLDNSTLVDLESLSILTMVTETMFEFRESHPFLHVSIVITWVLSLIVLVTMLISWWSHRNRSTHWLAITGTIL